MELSVKPISVDQFRLYQIELVGDLVGMHGRLARALGTSEISVKRYATNARPIPDYIAQSLRTLVLLKREKLLNKLNNID